MTICEEASACHNIVCGQQKQSTDLIWAEVEIPELPALQVVRHVGRLLLVGQGILPDVDPPAPPHGQQAPLADVAPGGWAWGEVGVQRLVGSEVPHLHLPIRPCRHHVVTCRVCSHRQHWALHTCTQFKGFSTWFVECLVPCCPTVLGLLDVLRPVRASLSGLVQLTFLENE